MMWLLYELLLLIGLMVYIPKSIWRKRLPHRGWAMRLGRYPEALRQRLGNRPAIWVHAVSVGEAQASQPLIHALAARFPQDPVVLSTITPSGFAVASHVVGSVGVPIYFPLDLRPCVRRALRLIRPRLLVLMEAELWPVVIHLTKTRGTPIAVVNGRISARAFPRYQAVKPLLQGMLREVELFVMQSQLDADRIIALGAAPGKVRICGSLKWDASLTTRPGPEEIQQCAARAGLSDQGTVIVAGSTHRGEEASLVQALQVVRESRPSVRLILAPRHLERCAEVEGIVRQAGLIPRRISQETGPQAWDVGIVDRFGQLAQYYGLATVVFIGGSLIPHGGQNPLEAASLGKPILFGPFMQNFAEITRQLLDHRAARQLSDGVELGSALQACLADPAATQAMGQRAQALTLTNQGVTQRTLQALEPLFDRTPSDDVE